MKKVFTFLFVPFLSILYLACSDQNDKGISEQAVLKDTDTFTTSIVISPNIPLDLADPSNLKEAADYAWREFIAITWPAKAQGPIDFPRGKPLQNGKYGEKGPTGQVVWETFRHRVEVFPGEGYPNGYDSTKPDYGFSAKPDYIYSNGTIPPINKNNPNAIPPFNNLDEVTQISLNSMYAGAYGHYTGSSDTATVESQKILFQAKVNEDYYHYVAKNKYFQSDSTSVINIKSNTVGFLTTGNTSQYPSPYINLPASDAQKDAVGSIEIKAAWRKLNPEKEDTTKFYTSRVRYYSGNGSMNTVKGYIDSDDPSVNEVWGLVALHIIHKTPNAPAFVYATFSHSDNLLDSIGNNVEDAYGQTFPQYLQQEPFSPALNIIASKAPDIPQVVYTKTANVNTNSPQLYFQNVAGKPAITTGSANGNAYTGPVVVNRRLFPIPQTIVTENKVAHTAIRKVNPKAVWLNYKLVNVQAEPLDYERDSSKIKDGLEPTYFLANEVVETNPSLQHFSGGLNGLDGTISNYVYNLSTGKKEYDYNVFIRNASTSKSYLMGGCMGCHGSQGQKQGGDFSVLLANGRIADPDVIEANQMNLTASLLLSKKYGLIIKKN